MNEIKFVNRTKAFIREVQDKHVGKIIRVLEGILIVSLDFVFCSASGVFGNDYTDGDGSRHTALQAVHSCSNAEFFAIGNRSDKFEGAAEGGKGSAIVGKVVERCRNSHRITEPQVHDLGGKPKGIVVV